MEFKDLASVGILLVIAAIVLAVGSQILGEVKTSDVLSTYSVTNESRNFAANNTYYATNNMRVAAVSAMYDDASHTNTYGSSFYTVDPDYGVLVLTNGTGGYPNMTTGTHYYDYTYYGVSYNMSQQGQEGLATLGDYLPTIGLVVAAVLVIGIVMGFFSEKETFGV